MLDTEQFFNENKFYKFVNKVDDKYFSFYDKSFEYIKGEEVEAKKEGNSSWNRDEGKLFFNEKYDISSSTYSSRNGVLIEVSIKPEHFLGAAQHITASKCTMIREVPKEEYQEWL